MRLETLSCTEIATGEIIETKVVGYVAGEDGKTGVRGVVVSKDAQFLAGGAAGGILSGFANVAKPDNYVSPLSLSGLIQGPSMQEKFQNGLGTGAANSMDRLSKYYIDRAEQLQPVIQVAAGRKVDVVFTASADIGGSSIKQEIAKVRNEARNEIAKEEASKDQMPEQVTTTEF